MTETTGGFASAQLLREAATLVLPSLTIVEAIELGEIAMDMARNRTLPVAIEVRLKEWTVFHVSLPGSSQINDSWIDRKARVVMATGKSTLYERVLAQEQGIDWYSVNGLSEESHATHGGGIALNVEGVGFAGMLLVSGLPQVDDHLFGVEAIVEFLARTGENQ